MILIKMLVLVNVLLLFFQKNWQVGIDNYYYFGFDEKKKGEEALPSKELVTHTLEYARELEMIV